MDIEKKKAVKSQILAHYRRDAPLKVGRMQEIFMCSHKTEQILVQN